jgi:hypothetical protein
MGFEAAARKVVWLSHNNYIVFGHSAASIYCWMHEKNTISSIMESGARINLAFPEKN